LSLKELRLGNLSQPEVGQLNSWAHGTTRRASFTPASITFPVLLSFEGLLITIRPFPIFFFALTFTRVILSLFRFRDQVQIQAQLPSPSPHPSPLQFQPGHSL
jgi:hypothetical protein